MESIVKKATVWSCSEDRQVKEKKRGKYSKIGGRGFIENKNEDRDVLRKSRIVYKYEKQMRKVDKKDHSNLRGEYCKII